MKKLILLSILSVIALFSPSNSFAQSSTDCWPTHMIRQYSTCSPPHTKCLQECSFLDTTAERKVCFEECGRVNKLCTDKAVADYKTCVAAGKQTPTTTETKETQPTMESSKEKDQLPQSDQAESNSQPGFDEAACHESCQSDYDTCTNECKSADTFNSSDTGGYADQLARDKCYNTFSSCSTAIYSRSGCEYGACQKEVEEKCDTPYFKCLEQANNGTNTDSSSLDSCISKCEQTKNICGQTCQRSGQTSNLTEPSEKLSVGVSSKNFKELARMQNELRQAQAELEKVKQSRDPRWEAKKDFAQQFQNKLQKYPEEQQDTLQIMRDRLEEVKSDAELYQKIKDFRDWFKGTDLDTDSGGMGSAIAVGNDLNDFLDLIADGVSADDAVAKVLIDSTAVDLNPFVKTADMVATLPDEIMGSLGIPEDHWSRKPTIYLSENSPSSFVGMTTDAMIKTHNFTNVGGALQVAWDDLAKAEGFGEKAQSTIDLVGTAVGALPVAVTMGVRDSISSVFDAVKFGGNAITEIFTYGFGSHGDIKY